MTNPPAEEVRIAELATGFALGDLDENELRELYDLLRLKDPEIPYDEFKEKVNEMRNLIMDWKAKDQIDAAQHMEWDIDDLIKDGLYNLGLYHAKKTLKLAKSGAITTEDMKLLLYYRNRLEGYGLEKNI